MTPEARTAFEELMDTIRGLAPIGPAVASFAVAPDVWAALKQELPVCRGASLTAGALSVRSDPWLPRGWIIPLDREGKPMLKPAEKTS